MKSARFVFFKMINVNKPSLMEELGASFSNPPTELVRLTRKSMASPSKSLPSYSILTSVALMEAAQKGTREVE